MGRWGEAENAFRSALSSLHLTWNAEPIAVSLHGLALALLQLEKPGWEALLQQACQIQAVSQDRALLKSAVIQGNPRWMGIRRGNYSKGIEFIEQALPVSEREYYLVGQAYKLLGQAKVKLHQGHLEKAFEDATAAIDLLETKRAQLQAPVGRMVSLDPRFSYFDTYLEIAMAIHRREPTAGYDLEALAASERARARGLLELLAERYKGLAASSAHFEPQSVEDLKKLCESDTTFLVYYFNQSSAYLWILNRGRVQSFNLGPSVKLLRDLQMARLYFVRYSDHDNLKRILEKVAADLLPDQALSAATRRLIVVGDRPLRLIPFALLPSPATGEPLVKSLEISYLPSVSILQALRSLPSPEPSPEHVLAVVADPVFPPVQIETDRGALDLPSGGGLDRLEPLPHSRVEAERLLALAPPESSLALLGPVARRDLILDGKLAPYRYIHFATHGLFDPSDVRRSGLALSAYDPSGKRIEAFLSFGDIEKLRISADLVVASACDTAIGKNLRGEGPVGVSDAFLAAGARRTIGSLWQTDDRFTAEFMSELYRLLLVEKLSPAAALRRTQLHFLDDDNPYRDPDWAAFVLLGEYL
jgi:CHAT domain-containing protein